MSKFYKILSFFSDMILQSNLHHESLYTNARLSLGQSAIIQTTAWTSSHSGVEFDIDKN